MPKVALSSAQVSVDGLANMIPANLTLGVVVALLRRDFVARCILAAEMGEMALKEKELDAAARAAYDASNGDGCEPPTERSWDEIMCEALDRIAATPGGRGEADCFGEFSDA